MHPLVQATTRTPGPSMADPVVNECRNPMSPDASALRTSDSGRFSPRLTRRSNGLLAMRGVISVALICLGIGLLAMERAADDIHLLRARQPHEIHGIAGHADGEIRKALRMLHRFHQRVAIEHVDVH